MRVLVTGACGVLGAATVATLAARGHRVRGFDRPGKAAARIARTLPPGTALRWGDVRDAAAVADAVADQDAVVHLAAVLPPLTDRAPELAEAVNVGGTRHVVAAAEASPQRPLVVFASSVSVFGPIAGREPPRRADETPVATDAYTRHKLACEALLRAATVPWVILRVGVALDPARPAGDVSALRMMFEIRAEHRMEYVHPRDVATAIASSLDCAAARGRVLLIGGGPRCRIRQHELLATITDALGLAPLPPAAFGDGDYYTDWMDTTESEALLRFQHHAFDDYRRGVHHEMRWARRLLRPVRPLARQALLRLSGPWRRRTTPAA